MSTATVADFVARTRRTPRARTRQTAISVFLDEALSLLEQSSTIRWPSERWRDDPVGFARQILGQDPWEKQIEILEAIRDYDRVTVSSGHKIGKSHTAGMAALWWYCTRTDARVVMTSTTARQVDEILWREVRKLRARAGVCLDCKRAAARLTPAERMRLPVPCPHSARPDGKMGEVARSGLKAEDLRQIVGFTARDPEAVAGVSGENILYILDEASGIPDAIFEAIEGNRAGGAKILLFSNPTRNEGEFYASHHEKALQFEKDGTPILGPDGRQKGFYYAIRVSSEETPNARLGRKVIPGLATREWIEEKRAEWGEDSPLFKVRVRGEFVENEEGKIVSLHAIKLAEELWHETEAEGRLFIGLDPAGPGGGGDESAVAPRRGAKVLELQTKRGLDDDGHLVWVLDVIRVHRRPREAPPVVVVDREGPIGSSLYGHLRSYADRHPDAFVVSGVRSSDKATRRADLYDRVRDELWANFADWLRAGGTIPEDTRLEQELHAPEWRQELNGKLKATPKRDLKKLLGRSPDRADAVVLSTWEPLIVADDRDGRAEDDDDLFVASGAGEGLDPYAAIGTWDPYGLDEPEVR